MSPNRHSRQPVVYALVSILVICLLLLHRVYHEQSESSILSADVPTEDALMRDSKTQIVVASTRSEETSWVYWYFQHWDPQVYVTDDPSAPLVVPRNKGHEAMVYLTYIIDRYDSLPDTMVFIHASRFQWHNDDPDYDILPTLYNLRLSYVREVGYVNLRCVWSIGCPAEIRPFEDEEDDTDEEHEVVKKKPVSAKPIFRKAFQELLPEIPVPPLVSVSCCSQFAVSRETVQRHTKERYMRLRDWLLNTPLEDSLSGRVFEFSWHIIFGKEAYHCPSAKECYCNVFGLCDLSCSESSCDGRYVLPPYSTLPEGWPLIGWDHEYRVYTEPGIRKQGK
ncbi:hypothetical protein F5Y04DRAFT_279678 [Hypomontagnella monticulosa]|nr:hypothetical protein F5Y04DRAFT_279678 [Hypomontagnella monticulosa]